MTHASRWLRRVEITLWLVGLSLLGVALAAGVDRWKYQAEQERAFAELAAASQLAPRELELVSHLGPLETGGGHADPAAGDEPLAQEIAEAREPETGDEVPIAADPAVVVSKNTAAPPEDALALDPALMGRLEIPRLGISALVREGDDESTLRRAVGYVPGTARPGDGGNTALAGHRDTFFRPLARIRVDDRIRLVVPPHTYEYRVDSFSIVEPDELTVLDSTGTEELTLVTCHPFRFVGPAPDRFIVKATRIQ